MRALVVGYGHMGRLHRKILRDLGYNVTTVDPNPTAGAAQPTVPHRNYHAVAIACPIHHLAEQAHGWEGHEGALLVEKPLATNPTEAGELAAILRGQRVAVGYIERFNPQARALKRRLED